MKDRSEEGGLLFTSGMGEGGVVGVGVGGWGCWSGEGEACGGGDRGMIFADRSEGEDYYLSHATGGGGSLRDT